VHSESEDTQVTYVVNGIHNNTAIGNSDMDTTYVSDGVDEGGAVHEHDADVADVAGVDNWSDDSTWTYYEELSAHAGTGGAHVDSIESGSFHMD
jgi:hypothetical protein